MYLHAQWISYRCIYIDAGVVQMHLCVKVWLVFCYNVVVVHMYHYNTGNCVCCACTLSLVNLKSLDHAHSMH